MVLQQLFSEWFCQDVRVSRGRRTRWRRRAFLVSESGSQRPPVVDAWSVNPRHAVVSLGVQWRNMASSKAISGSQTDGLAGSPKAVRVRILPGTLPGASTFCRRQVSDCAIAQTLSGRPHGSSCSQRPLDVADPPVETSALEWQEAVLTVELDGAVIDG